MVQWLHRVLLMALIVSESAPSNIAPSNILILSLSRTIYKWSRNVLV